MVINSINHVINIRNQAVFLPISFNIHSLMKEENLFTIGDVVFKVLVQYTYTANLHHITHTEQWLSR